MKKAEMRTCPTIESILEEHGCEFVPENEFKWEPMTYTFVTKPFDLSKINLEKSKKTAQNRVNCKINREKVSDYIVGLRAKDKFPAMCIFKDEEGDLLIGDGYHRDYALLEDEYTHVVGIYLFSHPYAATDLIPTINSRTTGYQEPIKDRIEKCLNNYMLKEQRGDPNLPSRKEWARLHRLNEETFNRSYRIKEVITDLGRKCRRPLLNLESIEGNAIEAIGRVKKIDESSAIEIAKMTVFYKLPSKEVEAIVDEFLDPANSIADKHKAIAGHMQRLKINTSNGKKLSKPRPTNRRSESGFKTALTKLANISRKSDENKLKNLMTDPVIKQSALEIKSLLNKLI